MTSKFYAVVIHTYQDGGFYIRKFETLSAAQDAAKKDNSEIFEYETTPLQQDEDHKLRGKLIKKS